MLYYSKDYKTMTESELISASFAIETILQKALTQRDNPKYRAKFKNQPPPSINPAFSELRDNIAAEIVKRQSVLTSEEMALLTQEEIETLNADDLETMKNLKAIAKERQENAN